MNKVERIKQLRAQIARCPDAYLQSVLRSNIQQLQRELADELTQGPQRLGLYETQAQASEGRHE